MYSEKTIKDILAKVKKGTLSPEKAFEKIEHLPYENFSFARIDHHRHLRTALPEVVYAPGKEFSQLKTIIRSLKKTKQPIIVTRLEKSMWQRLKKDFAYLSYCEKGKIAYYRVEKPKKRKLHNGYSSTIAILTAGTCDIPIAEEASITLEVMGRRVLKYYDCGVAGLHRLLDALPDIRKADAIICIAGMEGALASVVAGLVNRPVLAVPTSVGYGASFQGVAPLLTMLNSCAPGVAVMNIDNGFGAACFALMITSQTGHAK